SPISGRGQRPRLQNLRFVHDHLWRWLVHLKLSAHLLDLSGLLFELSRELRSLLFDLPSQLRDSGFQCLHFAIQHGAMRHRCASTLRCATRVVRVHTIDAKLAESIHSNLTNGDAVPDLGVRGDTVDKAGSATRKDAADAYHAGFVPG